MTAAPLPPTSLDVGRVEDGRVMFDNWRGAADRPEPPPPAPLPPAERAGFAIIGLGRLSLGQILPAFASCTHARPTALVSGRADKAHVVARQYGIAADHVLDYAALPRLAEMADVQAVYIVTPNAMHLDQVCAAAAAGKHVLCEKPMATSSAEARAMVHACADAGVKLMVAYRCQYEPFNRAAIALARGGEYGRVKLIEAVNTQVQGPGAQWRMKGAMAGGGALPDIGLYCLNGARAMLGEEPIEVFARMTQPASDPRYADIEETIAWMMRFPSGAMAMCSAGYEAHESKDLRLRLERGWVELENAFAYKGQRLRIARRDADHEAVDEKRLAAKDQFALEIDHFARCVLENRMPHTPGEEGVQDHLIMEAIYRSAREGGAVTLGAPPQLDAFRGPAPQ